MSFSWTSLAYPFLGINVKMTRLRQQSSVFLCIMPFLFPMAIERLHFPNGHPIITDGSKSFPRQIDEISRSYGRNWLTLSEGTINLIHQPDVPPTHTYAIRVLPNGEGIFLWTPVLFPRKAGPHEVFLNANQPTVVVTGPTLNIRSRKKHINIFDIVRFRPSYKL